MSPVRVSATIVRVAALAAMGLLLWCWWAEYLFGVDAQDAQIVVTAAAFTVAVAAEIRDRRSAAENQTERSTDG